jgi:hypothetical protein
MSAAGRASGWRVNRCPARWGRATGLDAPEPDSRHGLSSPARNYDDYLRNHDFLMRAPRTLGAVDRLSLESHSGN